MRISYFVNFKRCEELRNRSQQLESKLEKKNIIISELKKIAQIRAETERIKQDDSSKDVVLEDLKYKNLVESLDSQNENLRRKNKILLDENNTLRKELKLLCSEGTGYEKNLKNGKKNFLIIF